MSWPMTQETDIELVRVGGYMIGVHVRATVVGLVAAECSSLDK